MGHFKGMVVKLMALMASTNDPIVQLAQTVAGSPIAHAALAGFDPVTETFDAIDCVSFNAFLASSKFKGKKGADPDFPTLAQAMMSPDADEWKEAMMAEIKASNM